MPTKKNEQTQVKIESYYTAVNKLHAAARNNDLAKVVEVNTLASYPDVEITSEYESIEKDSLDRAIQHGNHDILRELDKFGIDVHANEEHVLDEAAELGYINIVSWLLEKNADVTAGEGPLMQAVWGKNLEIVALLLAKNKGLECLDEDSIKVIKNRLLSYNSAWDNNCFLDEDDNLELLTYLLCNGLQLNDNEKAAAAINYIKDYIASLDIYDYDVYATNWSEYENDTFEDIDSDADEDAEYEDLYTDTLAQLETVIPKKWAHQGLKTLLQAKKEVANVDDSNNDTSTQPNTVISLNLSQQQKLKSFTSATNNKDTKNKEKYTWNANKKLRRLLGIAITKSLQDEKSNEDVTITAFLEQAPYINGYPANFALNSVQHAKIDNKNIETELAKNYWQYCLASIKKAKKLIKQIDLKDVPNQEGNMTITTNEADICLSNSLQKEPAYIELQNLLNPDVKPADEKPIEPIEAVKQACKKHPASFGSVLHYSIMLAAESHTLYDKALSQPKANIEPAGALLAYQTLEKKKFMISDINSIVADYIGKPCDLQKLINDGQSKNLKTAPGKKNN